MPATRTRPPKDADERTALLGWYDLQRGIVRLKCEGLSEDDAHRALVPSSPLMTVAGVVAHLAHCEDLWFRECFLGERATGRGFGPDAGDDDDFRVEGVTLAEVLADYEAACARSDAVFAAHGLDDTGSTAIHRVGTRRCAGWSCTCSRRPPGTPGHLDLLREQLDGETGYY